MRLGKRKHPHGRGEDHPLFHKGRRNLETPPRTWGRPWHPRCSRSLVRNTPTDVGKTYPLPWIVRVNGKHPHGRGEDKSGALISRIWSETPPRTWGRRQLGHGLEPGDRNTPTDVGKTPPRHVPSLSGWKHPHGRGEDPDTQAECFSAVETPPRTWGRQDNSLEKSAPRRNTPTDVGKTPAEADLLCQGGKHPHGRGEDGWRTPCAPVRVETPPRTWGRPVDVAKCHLMARNTPTDVGKTRQDQVACSGKRKHPHGRGEDWHISSRRLNS